MRDLGSITDGIQNAKSSEASWLKEPYVGRVKINSIVYSEDVMNGENNPYTGTPYFKYQVETLGLQENKKTELFFWRPKSGEDPEKSNNKLLKIKRFYDSCHVDATLKGEAYIEAVLGKECNMVIQMQERALNKAKPPKIVNNSSFWFSKPVDEVIEVTADKLFNRLNEKELGEFHQAAAEYNKSNPEKEAEKPIQPNENFGKIDTDF